MVFPLQQVINEKGFYFTYTFPVAKYSQENYSSALALKASCSSAM